MNLDIKINPTSLHQGPHSRRAVGSASHEHPQLLVAETLSYRIIMVGGPPSTSMVSRSKSIYVGLDMHLSLTASILGSTASPWQARSGPRVTWPFNLDTFRLPWFGHLIRLAVWAKFFWGVFDLWAGFRYSNLQVNGQAWRALGLTQLAHVFPLNMELHEDTSSWA